MDNVEILSSGELSQIKENLKQVEDQVKLFAQKAIDTEKDRNDQELDLLNIAPKKANWDLKRSLEEKMEPLNLKTRQAIVEIIKNKSKNSQ